MKSVVIIDDHPVLATALSNALENQRVATASTIEPWAPEAEQLMVDLAPDLCLLDLDLGHEQAAGMRFVRAASAAGRPAVMLTGSNDDAALGRCIEAGALGVVHKSTSFDQVIAQIQAVLDGEPCNSDTDILRWVLASRRQSQAEERLRKPFEGLSKREQVVLQHLLDGSRVDEIADLDYVSPATVRSQVRSVLQKLGVHSQLAAVASARQAGWTLAQAIS